MINNEGAISIPLFEGTLSSTKEIQNVEILLNQCLFLSLYICRLGNAKVNGISWNPRVAVLSAGGNFDLQ